MGMAGPSSAQWLNGCTLRAKYDRATKTITADVNDWGNLVRLAQLQLGITDDELAALNDGRKKVSA